MGISNRSLRVAGLFAFSIAAPAAAQDRTPSQSTPAPAPAPPSPNPDYDIVVSGFDAVPESNPLPGEGKQASRVLNSDSRAFVRCIHDTPPKLLRPIVEGHALDPKTIYALDKVIRTNTGCYHSFTGVPTPDYYGRCNPMVVGRFRMCRATFDRGALIEAAFDTYAPHFMLTRRDTLNRDTVARFRANEAVRGKYRSPTDRKFYDIVACMVQLEPQRAIRLLRAEPGHEQEVRQQIIAKTPFCTNNARKVQVDPYQFRFYLADAVYHWTLAAKNVETLILDIRAAPPE